MIYQNQNNQVQQVQQTQPVQQVQPVQVESEEVYFMLNTTSIYTKMVASTSKQGKTYRSMYFYLVIGGKEILKFSLPTWNTFYMNDINGDYYIIKITKENKAYKMLEEAYVSYPDFVQECLPTQMYWHLRHEDNE